MNKVSCSYVDDCRFAYRTDLTGAQMILKEVFCRGDPSKCEILNRHLSGKDIPNNMPPDGTVET
jgi:hypothetical protein